jgi:DNA uptake protein ComE-like DNA-binding protein
MRSIASKLGALAITAVMASVLMACGSATTSGTTSAPTSAASQPATIATSAAPATTGASAAQATSAPDTSSATAATAAKLNLNTVTEEQLMSTIPSFNQRMVREFMEYRPYISIQQFRKEIGKYVSADQVAAYEQYVYVPVDVDQADAATLQQLPGVDAAIVEQLIASRPYGSDQAFLAKLASLVPEAEAQQAASYLA